MKIIGITGGVGSGKSEVLAFLEKNYDAAVLRADEAGHRVMRKGTDCFDAIVELFGTGVVGSSGELDRGVIAEQVFRDRELLRRLEAIVHPAVRQEILLALEEERAAGRSFFFLESALLIEQEYDRITDEMWYIYAREDVRRERLRSSRQYSDEKITAVIRSQLPEEAFRRSCDFIIDNSGEFRETEKQIRARMKRYL